MFVHSTGLGKTVLTAQFSQIELNEESQEHGLTMKIEATEPVHWYITCDLGGDDIRNALKIALKPAVMGRVLKLLLRKSPSSQAKSGNEPGNI